MKPQKIVIFLISLGILCLAFFHFNPIQPYTQDKPITIGVVLPMEHIALHDIVEGFKDTLKKNYKGPVEIIIQNSQGDLNLQKAIIQQFIGQKVSIIVPIGTTATQMAAHASHTIPIVSLAARFSEAERIKDKPVHITGVHDEIDPSKSLDLMQQLFPKLHKISVIYTNNEKMFPEIQTLKQLTQKRNIELQEISVQKFSDLYQAGRSIDNNTDIIFILKDILIASGIQILVKEAESRKLPLMTSDEGSVKEGACFSLGVKEQSIGEQGALLAIKVIHGVPLEALPMEDISKLELFYNGPACERQGVSLQALEMAAKKMAI